MYRILTSLSVAAAALASSLSATVLVIPTTAPFVGPFVADSTGALLPAGNEVRIGYFESGFDPFEFSSDITTLSANFVSFGSRPISAGADMPDPFFWPESGVIAGEVNGPDSFAGRSIHLMVFKTSDNAFATPDLTNVVEFGVFGSPENPDWIFASGINGTAIETSQITQYIAGGLIENAGYVLNPENPYSTITLIPEPTTSALAGGIFAFGLLVFLRRRRNA